MNRPGRTTRVGSSSDRQLFYFRLILFAAGLAYLIFGWVYQTYIPRDFPMPMPQRLGAFSFFFLILLSTYLTTWAREHVELLMYLGVTGAFSHLVYFSYINNYALNYALSILIVIIVINFLLPGDRRLKWWNLGAICGIGTTALLGKNSAINPYVYVVSAASISFISYVLSSSKQTARRDYERLFQESPIGLVRCNKNGEVEDYNREMLRLAGNPPQQEFEEINILEVMGIDQNDLESVENRESQINFPWGEEVWVDYSIELIPRDQNTYREVLIACDDITDRKQAEDRVEYITYHDDLTQLYNRSYFQEKADEFSTDELYPLSVIFIDVDKLKLINDAFGHHTGDDLLVAASRVVKNSCRDEDLVFRWGGDEIVILLPSTGAKESTKISSRIQENCDTSKFEPIDLRLSLGRASADGYNKNTGLNHLLKEAEEQMYENKVEKQDSVSREILSAILEKLDGKAKCVNEHSSRVEDLVLQVGKALELQQERIERLVLVARYHDIGKISVDTEIVTKNYRQLTAREREELQGHSSIGYQIVKELHHISDLAQPILQHHEWWDGAGYPQGKSGKEIPLTARIVAVGEYYDFLVNPHCNNEEKVSSDQALQMIQDRAGTQFQPKIAQTFVDTI